MDKMQKHEWPYINLYRIVEENGMLKPLKWQRGLAVGLVLGIGLAQSFFAPLDSHPSLVQAQLGVDAAQAQLRALQSPIALQGGVSYTGYDLKPLDAVCTNGSLTPVQLATDPRCYPIPNQTGASLTLAFSPFAFGDSGDLIAQAAVGVEQSQLGLRQARANLEAQAIETAYRVEVAQSGVSVAQSAQKLSQASLDATRLRLERSAATVADVRQAEATARQAQGQVQESQRNLVLAQQNLTDLLGKLADPPTLEVPTAGIPPLVRQAELQAQLAQISYGKAMRAIWPVLQGSFTRNLSDNNSLSVGLDSRSLQPSLTYNYQDPGRTVPQNRIDNIYQVRLSVNLSFALLDALQAAQAQVNAAQQGIESAKRNVGLQENILRSALQSADSSLALAKAAQSDAEKNLSETRERERLGLVSPLSTLQAELTLEQAKLGMEQANANRIARILDLYRFYALPPSQTPVK